MASTGIQQKPRGAVRGGGGRVVNLKSSSLPSAGAGAQTGAALSSSLSSRLAKTSISSPTARKTKAKPAAGPQPRTGTASARRPYQAVETNIAKYDRTDPFAAVNALRKLLAVLPSRTGGNQLKLAMEEHALAMHLLGIVEPFIGLEPSQRRSLTRQPTEILDEITSHIDAKRDLLALGLTCKRLADIVFPRHFNYRVVRAKLSNLAVWHHLTVHRTLAQNLRVLEVLDERAGVGSVVVPPDVSGEKSDTDLEESSSDDDGGGKLSLHEKQTRVFLGALARMTRLDALVWSCGHPLVSLSSSVWPTVLKWCATLRSFQINDGSVFHPPKAIVNGDAIDDNARRDGKKVVKNGDLKLSLPRLSSLSVQSLKKGFGQSKKPELSDLVEILHTCPNLEELDIKYSPFRGAPSLHADSLFQYGRWPFLRSLHLSNVACSTEALEAASSFLASHDSLEVLHLTDFSCRGRAFDLPAGSLPRLKELRATKDVATRIMSCSMPTEDATRPLDSLEGMRLVGPGCDAFLEGLRRHPVKRLVLAGYVEVEDVRKLVECIPQVTYFDVGRKATAGGAGGGGANSGSGSASAHSGKGSLVGGGSSAGVISNVVDWLDLLAPLPSLAAFHGVRFFYAVSEHVLLTSSSSSPPSSSSTGVMLSGSGSTGTIPGTNVSAASNASDRSRLRKNDEIASLLAWKCPKLRRVDHWEGDGGKVIVLSRDGRDGKEEKVRWEVKRVSKT